MSRAQKYYYQLCYKVGEAGQLDSDSKVGDRFGVTPAFVKYWKTKFADPSFHGGELGGAHNCKFTADGQKLVEWCLWELVQINSQLTCTSYALYLTQIGISVDRK
jgi:hypothetical protein